MSSGHTLRECTNTGFPAVRGSIEKNVSAPLHKDGPLRSARSSLKSCLIEQTKQVCWKDKVKSRNIVEYSM